MKALSILPICVFLASVYSGEAFAGEQYYLNGHQTWCLYKSINWWYYARPKECQDLCGAAVQYRYQGKVGHSYDESARVLTIYLEDDFADLLSVLSHGRGRYRSATLQGSAGNILSGTSGTPTLTIEEHPLSNTYSVSFKSVDVAEYQQTIKEITSWRFVLSGKIWGLRNGKLALYRAPDNLRNCSKNKTANNDRTRFTLRIYRGDSDGVLADFVFQRTERKGKQPLKARTQVCARAGVAIYESEGISKGAGMPMGSPMKKSVKPKAQNLLSADPLGLSWTKGD